MGVPSRLRCGASDLGHVACRRRPGGNCSSQPEDETIACYPPGPLNLAGASDSSLRVARVIADTEAEGPGRRFAVWTQGCPLRCAGCCNPEMFGEDGGAEHPVDELAAAIAATPGIDGLSLLGGEPFAQAAACARLARAVLATGRTVVVFSGYTLAELRAGDDPGWGQLLAAADLLIDGRFDRDRPEAARRWIGSANQTVHELTGRVSARAGFDRPNTVELRLVRGALTVNGWPAAADAVRPRRWRGTR